MSTLAEIRAALGPEADRFTDQQLAEVAFKYIAPRYNDPKDAWAALGYDPDSSNFVRGFKIAGRNTLAAAGGLGALAGDVTGWEGLARSGREYAAEQAGMAQRMGRRTDDVDNIGEDPLAWAASGLGQVTGYVLPSIIGGGAGYGAARLAGGRMALNAAQAANVARAGAATGAFAANYGQSAGGIYNEQIEQGRPNAARALGYALPIAALDTAAEALPFLRAGSIGGNIARRAAVGAAVQAPVEAVTEVGQTVLERQAAYKDLLSDDAFKEYRNAAALGALGGGTIGAVGGAVDTSANVAEARRLAAEAELQAEQEQRRAAERAQAIPTSLRAPGAAPLTVTPRLPDMDPNDPKLQAPAYLRRDAARKEAEAKAAEEAKKAAEVAAVDAANAARAAKKQAALDALVDKDEAGKPMRNLSDRQVNAFLGLQAARDSGAITPALFDEKVGDLREVLRGNNGRATGAVLRDITKLVEGVKVGTAPAGGGAAVAPGAPAGGNPVVAGSAGAGGVLGSGPAAPAVPAPAPGGGVAATQPVGVGAGAGGVPAPVAPPVVAPSPVVTPPGSAPAQPPERVKSPWELGTTQVSKAEADTMAGRYIEQLNRDKVRAEIDRLPPEERSVENQAALEAEVAERLSKRPGWFTADKQIVLFPKEAKKREVVPFREVLRRLYAAPPIDRVLYGAVMDAVQNQSALTWPELSQIAATQGVALKEDAIAGRLAKYGVTRDAIDAASQSLGVASDATVAETTELEQAATGEDAGFRVVNSAAELNEAQRDETTKLTPAERLSKKAVDLSELARLLDLEVSDIPALYGLAEPAPDRAAKIAEVRAAEGIQPGKDNTERRKERIARVAFSGAEARTAQKLGLTPELVLAHAPAVRTLSAVKKRREAVAQSQRTVPTVTDVVAERNKRLIAENEKVEARRRQTEDRMQELYDTYGERTTKTAIQAWNRQEGVAPFDEQETAVQNNWVGAHSDWRDANARGARASAPMNERDRYETPPLAPEAEDVWGRTADTMPDQILSWENLPAEARARWAAVYAQYSDPNSTIDDDQLLETFREINTGALESKRSARKGRAAGAEGQQGNAAAGVGGAAQPPGDAKGSPAPLKMVTAEENARDLAAYRSANWVSAAELEASDPDVAYAFDRVRKLGYENLLNAVHGWDRGDANSVFLRNEDRRGSVRAVYLDSKVNRETLLFAVLHELAHVADLPTNSEVGRFSGGQDFAVDEFITEGPAADALLDLHINGSREMRKILRYPFSMMFNGDPKKDLPPEISRAELYAQAFAIAHTPGLRGELSRGAPEAYVAVRDSIEQIRTLYENEPTAQRTREEIRTALAVPDAAGPVRMVAEAGVVGGGSGRLPPGGRPGRGPDSAPQGEPPARLKAELDREARIREQLSQPVKDFWTDFKELGRKAGAWMLTNFQLYEVYRDKLPALEKFNRFTDMMRVDSQVLQRQFDDVAKDWAALPKAEVAKLNKLAMDVTLARAYPNKKLTDDANAHLTEEEKAKHPALASRFNALLPETKKVFEAALAASDSSLEQMQQAMEALHKKYGKKIGSAKKMPGPYFPLMRFGEYLAIGESSEYLQVKQELESLEGDDEATNARREELRKQFDTLSKSPSHYYVSAHESRSEMEAKLKELKEAGLQARPNKSDLRLGALPARNVQMTIANLTAAATKGLNEDSAQQVERALASALLKSLPEMHALQRQAERRGIAGAEPDMLRAFAAYGRQQSFYTSRLKYAKEQIDALEEVRAQASEEGKDKTSLLGVYEELQKRLALNLEFKPTPIQDMLGQVGYVWYLGTSPAYLFMQGAQPWLVTGPVLAGRYGGAKATKALGKASRDAMAVLSAARYKDGKFDLWSGISENSIPGKSVNEDRKALRELIDRGIVDEGMTYELAAFAEGGANSPLVKASRGIGWAAQQIELVNRVTTALAAFRLARGNGTDYDAAVQSAYEVTVNTQMDYSQEGTARFMREGGGVPMAKLLFQFRRYQQAMLYLLGRNLYKLFVPGERKIAAATLGYFAGSSALAAGAMGMPFAGLAFLAANAAIDDDDPEGDAETRFRNASVDLWGKELGTLFARGLPALFGADLSERIGLGYIYSPYPRLEAGRTAQETVGNVAREVAGPVLGGLTTNMVDAAMFFANGDLARGVERMLPKFLADPLRAIRYQNEGLVDRRGDEVLGPEEIGAWNITLRALGSASNQEQQYYSATAAVREIKDARQRRISRIAADYRRALREGDMAAVRKDIAEFNRDHPKAPIKPADELRWRRDAARSRQERGDSGVRLTQRDQQYRETIRYAE